MCDKVIIENGGMLEFIFDCYKVKKYVIMQLITIQDLSPNCYKTQKMCNKAVGTYAPAMQFVLERNKIHKMCGKVVCIEPFMLKYYTDKYKTCKMRDEAADSYLVALKFALD